MPCHGMFLVGGSIDTHFDGFHLSSVYCVALYLYRLFFFYRSVNAIENFNWNCSDKWRVRVSIIFDFHWLKSQIVQKSLVKQDFWTFDLKKTPVLIFEKWKKKVSIMCVEKNEWIRTTVGQLKAIVTHF